MDGGAPYDLVLHLIDTATVGTQNLPAPWGSRRHDRIDQRYRERLDKPCVLVVGEFLGMNRAPFCEGMRTPHRQYSLPAVNHGSHCEVRLVHGQPVDYDVDLAVAQRLVRVTE